jgi:predicted Zn finger-like uncharacterized protein
MKFTCDKCSAQYMISDEKVGPNGVKVRCKKCGNVVVVRRPAQAPAAAPAAEARPAAPSTAAGGNGLDAELGQAFDTAFGEARAQEPKAPAPDLGATQAMGPEDASRIAAPAASAPVSTEWYVAIGQAQVGPLPLSEVKRKWEAGDVGPDSLVWRPGMGDWQALSSVGELAAYLAPVPRAEERASRAEPEPARAEAQPARTEPVVAAAQGGDVTWKPLGASALAALASEEIAGRAEPKAEPAPAANGARSLVDELPDGGGVDPTGAVPLPIKGMERTDEKKIERRSSIATRAEETRQKRSVARAAIVGAVVVLAAGGGAAAYMLAPAKRSAPAPVAAAQPAPVPPPPAAPPETQPAPAAPPAAPSEPPAAAQPAAAAIPPPAAAEPPAAAPAPPPQAAPPPPPARRVAKAEPVRTTKRERRQPVAQAAPPPTERPPAPAPAPGRKKDSLLDFDSKDSALDEALGGGGTGRSVYVPPARAAAPDLPEKLSPAQINESVAGRIDALRKCVSDQKARDPGASGVLKLRWIIGADGNVRDVKTLTSDYTSSPFAHCITGVVRTIRFPRSTTTGQEVTFPFSF